MNNELKQSAIEFIRQCMKSHDREIIHAINFIIPESGDDLIITVSYTDEISDERIYWKTSYPYTIKQGDTLDSELKSAFGRYKVTIKRMDDEPLSNP